MKDRNYWIGTSTPETLKGFISAGSKTFGFSKSRWKTVQNIKTGDYIIHYLTKRSKFIGVLEVDLQPFCDKTPRYVNDTYPCRVKVILIKRLDPNNGISPKDTLLFDPKNPKGWIGKVRRSPTKLEDHKGKALVTAIIQKK